MLKTTLQEGLKFSLQRKNIVGEENKITSPTIFQWYDKEV